MKHFRPVLIRILILPLLFAGLFSCGTFDPAGGSITGVELSGEKIQFLYLQHLIEANRLKSIGNFEEATKELEACLRLKPEEATLYYELANISIYNKQINKAIAYCKEAVSRDENNLWYQLLYVNLLSENKDYNEAAKILSEVLKKHPEKTELEFQLAAIYSSERKTAQKAIDIYNKIEEREGISRELSFRKEDIYRALGKNEKALNEVKALSEAFPENTSFLGIYAETLTNNKKYKEAEEIYQRLFKLDPENGIGHLSYGEFQLRSGNIEKALAEFQTGINNEELDAQPKIDILTKLRTAYLDKIGLDHFIGLLQMFMEQHPNNAQAIAMMADYHIVTGQYEKARTELIQVIDQQKENFKLWSQLLSLDNTLVNYQYLYSDSKEALEYFPNYAPFFLQNAYACERTKRYQQGIDQIDAGLDFVIDDSTLLAGFYSQKAEILNRMNQFPESDQAFEKAIKTDPTQNSVINNYAYYLALRGENLDRAKELIEIVVSREAQNTTYLDTYAWVLFVQKEYNKALEVIQKAIDAGTKSPVVIEHFGDILFMNNKIAEAVDAWEKAFELQPENKHLKEKIEKQSIN